MQQFWKKIPARCLNLDPTLFPCLSQSFTIAVLNNNLILQALQTCLTYQSELILHPAALLTVHTFPDMHFSLIKPKLEQNEYFCLVVFNYLFFTILFFRLKFQVLLSFLVNVGSQRRLIVK